jgi:hypothetical protein
MCLHSALHGVVMFAGATPLQALQAQHAFPQASSCRLFKRTSEPHLPTVKGHSFEPEQLLRASPHQLLPRMRCFCNLQRR